jgi:hypothetical protein
MPVSASTARARAAICPELGPTPALAREPLREAREQPNATWPSLS